MTTEIIGHRGAAGTALENTIPSFQQAVKIGVKTVEFDVRITKDGQFVVCHDDSLSRISNSHKRIKDLTLQELQQIPLYNTACVPLLRDVLDFARQHSLAVIVEVKIKHNLEELCSLLDDYQDLDMRVASFYHEAMGVVRKLRPFYRIYLAEGHRPIEVFHKAKVLKIQGIDLNYKLINPLNYYLARRWNLDIMLYTVNNPTIARVIRLLYPNVAICTDHPERFINMAAPRQPKKEQ